MKWFLLSAAAVLASTPVNAKVIYVWAEAGPAATTIIRAVTDGGCPEVNFDGFARPMTQRPRCDLRRVDHETVQFTGCEAAIPAGAHSASVDGQPIALPQSDPRRIAAV